MSAPRNQTILLLAVILIFPLRVSAEDDKLSPAFLAHSEEGTMIVRDQKSGEIRSRVRYNLQRVPRANPARYELIQDGEGDYDRFQNARWTVTTQWEEHNGLIRVLNSRCVIKDQNNQTLAIYEKIFDDSKKTILFTRKNAQSGAGESYKFPIKGPTTDDSTLIYFLRKFAANSGEKSYRNFYLLSSEPRLYDVRIRFLREEILSLPSGDSEALKFQLFADLGPLTELAMRVIPPTFIWYKKNDPSVWLKYSGLETGQQSTHVVSYLVEMSRP